MVIAIIELFYQLFDQFFNNQVIRVVLEDNIVTTFNKSVNNNFNKSFF